MWIFYHDVVASGATPDPSHVTSFMWGLWVILTGVIIMAPSLLENRENYS